MTKKVIKEREDITVTWIEDRIVKKANTQRGKETLGNAVCFFKALQDTPYVPELFDYSADTLVTRYNLPQDVVDPDMFRYRSIDMLLTLLSRNIIHSDLTKYNFVVHYDTPVVFDFDEARFAWESGGKRAGMDADWFYPAVAELDTSRTMQRWLLIREHIKHLRGYATLTDLGTLYGDFCALAASEGFKTVGYDNNAFDGTGIEIAQHRWGKYGCQFHKQDLVDVRFKSEIALLLSTWTYVVNQHGIGVAKDFLREVIKSCDVLFFENHTTGDGFVQDFITEEYLRDLLVSMSNKVEQLAVLPVAGRDAKRILWKIN